MITATGRVAAHVIAHRVWVSVRRHSRVLNSWASKARPFLLSGAALGTITLGAMNGAMDRYGAELSGGSPPSTAAPGGNSSPPWEVFPPAVTDVEGVLPLPYIGFVDLPELMPPRDAAVGNSRPAPPGHRTGSGMDTRVWLLLAAAVLAAGGFEMRRRCSNKPTETGSRDPEPALLEPEERAAAGDDAREPVEEEQDPGLGAAPDIDEGAGDGVGDGPTSAEALVSESTHAPRRIHQSASTHQAREKGVPLAARNSSSRREDAGSRVVLYQRTSWGD